MSMMDGNENDEIESFLATIGPGEGNGAGEERLQRALAMSMMDGNDNGGIGFIQAVNQTG